ncbi:hypothetical protein FPQ18DRAFT_135153 [Pyronema domesticum]|uniref:Similar to Uncharacterized protein C4C5.03 acc. no. O14166 n=1 Tax=Pyronema omphalodes (strain CBS 100304) TaxID=1076935 RepID=U4KY56_PYROM|nr:hypothetical protein FPQ18DRAFT_135153 [Pyronema domesticum]CCX06480.1 Similar to Uncharacterized protein C4C5.03; acc. no. O14166 [Pyronema omphalodes CBS 100304]
MESPLSAPAAECTSLLNPSVLNLVFSFVILFGILVSYLPQHIRIISRGTSEGISPLFLLLGVTSGTCAFLNILILSWGVLGCCSKGIGPFNCFAASMGVAQVGTQWLCFAIILALYLIFLPQPTGIPGGPQPATKKTAVAVSIGSIVHLAAMGAITLYLGALKGAPEDGAGDDPTRALHPSAALVNWANFLGVQSTVLASIQYIPQLFTTWRLKHVGSLSIPMMCIQTPGSFVWAISLATREGTRWSSWATYVVTGCLQGALLAMCITWEIADRKARRKAEVVAEAVAARGQGERQPLLQAQRTGEQE